MKSKFLTLILTLCLSQTFGQNTNKNNVVQLALLLDVSSSMDGLINQAKSELWNIVIEVSKASKNGQASSLEIALFEYGRSTNDRNKGYIKKHLDYTNNLDTISKVLFSLTTNGGDEYCGMVIDDALKQLQWRENDSIYKVIFIAGNEPFNQGPVNYSGPCQQGAEKGIFINTIHCGDSLTGVRTFWKHGAELGKGEYFFINSNLVKTDIATPYDSLINIYGDSLNNTYWNYGSYGTTAKAMQLEEDTKAKSYSKTGNVKRQIAKSKGNVYKNDKWDVVDANLSDSFWLMKTDEKALPVYLQGKSLTEKKLIIDSLSKERVRLSNTIGELGKKRDEYIKTNTTTDSKEKTLGDALIEVIRRQAGKKGFVFKEG